MPTEFSPLLTENMELIPYDLDYIPDIFRKKAKLELFEDEETRVHSLKLLKSMLQEESNLNWQDDDLFLIAFLRARKFDVKRAFNLVKTFYVIRDKHKELFHNYNFEDVRRTIKSKMCGYLPYRDRDGSVILLIRTSTWYPHENSMGDLMRALTSGLLVSILSEATQIAGFKVIFDLGGFTLNQLAHVSPSYLWLFAEALQNCFPARFGAVHMVNEGSFWSYIWAILKQPLTKKLRDRFHFHGKNVKKLHKYFSPRILPVEYGGELPPFDNDTWLKRVEECKDFLIETHSYGFVKHKIQN